MQIPVEVLEELEVVKAEDPTEVFKAIEIIEDKPKKPRKSRKPRTTKKTEDSTDVEVLDQPRAKEKQIATLNKQYEELQKFEEKLKHLADQRIAIDLDDGVKVNYGKFGDLLANVKEITGAKGD